PAAVEVTDWLSTPAVVSPGGPMFVTPIGVDRLAFITTSTLRNLEQVFVDEVSVTVRAVEFDVFAHQAIASSLVPLAPELPMRVQVSPPESEIDGPVLAPVPVDAASASASSNAFAGAVNDAVTALPEVVQPLPNQPTAGGPDGSTVNPPGAGAFAARVVKVRPTVRLPV